MNKKYLDETGLKIMCDHLNGRMDQSFIELESQLNSSISQATEDMMNYIKDNMSPVQISLQDIKDTIYPIGSFYFTADSVSPAALFGGIWEQIKDRFLLASGDKYIAGATGGEAEHILTIAELAKHSHPFPGDNSVQDSKQVNGANKNVTYSVTSRFNTGEAGEGQPHNNMPPYLCVNIWQRKA